MPPFSPPPWPTGAAKAQAQSKIKKQPGRTPTLKLTENPDILSGVAHRTSGRPRLVVGFAAETDDVIANARAKRIKKGCDWIVANDVSAESGVMGGDIEHRASGHRERRRIMAGASQGSGRAQVGRVHSRGARRGDAMNAELRIVRLPHAADLPLPAYQTERAAGLDLVAAVPADAAVTIAPGERAMIPTGIAIALPPGHEGQIRPRSGIALRHGVTVLNSPGTIDADYRGEIQVILVNLGAESFEITRGTRIAQMIIAPIIQARIIESDRLDVTGREGGGFRFNGGSSEVQRRLSHALAREIAWREIARLLPAPSNQSRHMTFIPLNASIAA